MMISNTLDVLTLAPVHGNIGGNADAWYGLELILRQSGLCAEMWQPALKMNTWFTRIQGPLGCLGSCYIHCCLLTYLQSYSSSLCTLAG